MATKPTVEVLEYGKLIKEPEDFLRLRLVDWGRLNGVWEHEREAMEAVCSWVVNTTVCTVIKTPLWQYPQRDDWPGWEHVGVHPELGQQYWNYFHYRQLGELYFDDEPDFAGYIYRDGKDKQPFHGDIGQVSPSTFSMTYRSHFAHDLWISVLDSETQVILEPMVCIADLSMEAIEMHLEP